MIHELDVLGEVKQKKRVRSVVMRNVAILSLLLATILIVLTKISLLNSMVIQHTFTKEELDLHEHCKSHSQHSLAKSITKQITLSSQKTFKMLEKALKRNQESSDSFKSDIDEMEEEDELAKGKLDAMQVNRLVLKHLTQQVMVCRFHSNETYSKARTQKLYQIQKRRSLDAN